MSAGAAGEPFAADTPGAPPVRGVLHRAAAGDAALVLAHGAGSGRDAPLLVALAGALAARGISVLRCDLPFRQDRPEGPPSPRDAERDRAGLRHAVQALRRGVAGRVALGGHSYGGRQASMLVAAEPALAAALLLLSYPLHPPRRPDRPRTAHFTALRTPVMFVHGSRDAFGSLEEVRAAMTALTAPATLLALDGAAHALRPSAAGAIADAFAAWWGAGRRPGSG